MGVGSNPTITDDRRAGSGEPWKHAVAGAAAGMASTFVTCPFDVVKARIQLQQSSSDGVASHGRPTGTSSMRLPSGPTLLGASESGSTTDYKGTFRSLGRIWREEGVRGWYRGFGISLAAYLPNWMIYFTCYHQLKLAIHKRSTYSEHEPVNHIIAAVSAGTICLAVMNPIWVIRTRLMVQTKNKTLFFYGGTLDAFHTICKHEGLKGFYSGLVPSLWGTLHVAIQFPFYEYIKGSLLARGDAFESHSQASLFSILAASIVSKLVASTITYPHEVIRTKLQASKHFSPEGKVISSYKGARDCMTKIYQENHSIKGFYRGLATNLIRVLPASAITFLTYEALLGLLGAHF